MIGSIIPPDPILNVVPEAIYPIKIEVALLAIPGIL
jgi:hypothetical protein